MRACLNVLLESLPCLQNGFSGLLLEVRNFAMKKIGFIDREELDEEVVWTLPPCIQGSRVGIKPMLRLFEQWERKKSESNGVLWDSSNWDCVANLQKILKMSISILRRFAMKRASLHHGYKCGLEHELFFSAKNIRTYDYIGDSREGIIVNHLNSCTKTSWCNTTRMNRFNGWRFRKDRFSWNLWTNWVSLQRIWIDRREVSPRRGEISSLPLKDSLKIILKTFWQIESTHAWLCLLQSKQESKLGKITITTLSKYLGQCLPRQQHQKCLLIFLWLLD